MRICLIGFGVVGRSFVKLLTERAPVLANEYGFAAKLVCVADSGGAAVSQRGLIGAELLAAKESDGTVGAVADHGLTGCSVEQLIADCDADVVIDATPSDLSSPGVAMGHLRAAFRTAKNAITVNKAPLATAMPALLELAAHNRVQFRYSGTVGGGTPMLALACECARGDDVVRLRGVLNGTTNYILSRMHETDIDFDSALAEAARLGYAETDPSADIDGIDAATKVVILSNLIMSRPTTIRDVDVTGIRNVSRNRIETCKSAGRVLKLVGEIGESARVGLAEVNADSPLNVPANLNALTLTLRSSGDVTLVGRGAGGIETATAILRDLLDIWQTVGAAT